MRRMYSKPQLLEAVEQEAEVNGLKAFENIVDKDGHKRFIEGTITPVVISGVNYTYAKWSLSGNHLMIVIAGNVANGTSISFSDSVSNILLPQWIIDKIYPSSAFSNTLVAQATLVYMASDRTTQSDSAFLRKTNSTTITTSMGSITLTADRDFRIAFDLLIDNE